MAGAAAIGFRAHTGWAAVVAIAGPLSEPEVLARKRLELDAGLTSRFVFHAAAELEAAAAERHVRRARELVGANARAAVAAFIAELAPRKVVVAGLATGGGRLPAELAEILASHPLRHSAEGELYRQALADAAAAAGLRVYSVPSKVLRARAAEKLGDEVDETLAAMGQRAGRPWAMDQKESALVAWLALAG